MLAGLTLAKVGKAAWSIATIIIPIPLALIVAAGLWLWIDTGSRVRTAVDRAVRDMVAGAEIAALEAKVDAERQLRAWAEGQRDEARRIQAAEAAARQEFSDRLALSEQESEDYAKEIAKLQERQPVAGCVADDAFIGGLRNN